MKITFILKDKTDAFYDHLNKQLSPKDQFHFLNEVARQGRATIKIGNGSFRDRVDLNGMLRGDCLFDFKLEPRRGYKLATFEITILKNLV